jgi:hypothetical protein
MPRAVLHRRTSSLVLLPVVALVFTDCGGNDVIDGAADATSDGAFDAAPDAVPDDGSDDTSSSEGGSADAALDADAADALEGAGDGSRDAGDGGLEAGTAVPVAFGIAQTFALLASATITNVGVTTAITGDVGISPGTALVNLPAGQVTGTLHLGDPTAAQALSDLGFAYNDLAGRACDHTMTSVDLGGKTLTPGVYCFAVAAAQSGADLTLDGQGDANATWVFQIGSTLTIATNASTNMINGGNACRVYWQVGSSATINTGARFKGNILAKASITLLTGASVSPGRALAETAAVTLDSNAISNAGCP